MFFRQSWRSNYCGVYATAMLLTHLGEPVNSREGAKRLFGLQRTNRIHYKGASLREMFIVLKTTAMFGHLRWTLYARMTSYRFILGVLGQVRHGPTLLSFDAVSKSGIRASHVVVVTDYLESGSLCCVDPLAPTAPPGPLSGNVVLSPRTGIVTGSGYRADPVSKTWLLQWRR